MRPRQRPQSSLSDEGPGIAVHSQFRRFSPPGSRIALSAIPRQDWKSASGVRTILASGYSLRRSAASQRPDCAGLVLIDIKYSGQFCHVEQLVDSLVQVYEPKLPILIKN